MIRKTLFSVALTALCCVSAQADEAATSTLPAALQAANGQVVSTSDAHAVRGQGGTDILNVAAWSSRAQNGRISISEGQGVFVYGQTQLGGYDVNFRAAGEMVQFNLGRDTHIRTTGAAKRTDIEGQGDFHQNANRTRVSVRGDVNFRSGKGVEVNARKDGIVVESLSQNFSGWFASNKFVTNGKGSFTDFVGGTGNRPVQQIWLNR